MLVEINEPDKHNYFYSGNCEVGEQHSANCQPKREDRGCYGDCIDCYHRDRDAWERKEKA